jgi:predicted CXXCH cytochrome family protein
MSGRTRITLLAAALALAMPPTAGAQRAAGAARSLTPVQAEAGRAGGMCGVCHSDIRVEFDRGVHHTEGVGCVACHGGDPAATTVAAAHRAPFRGAPARRDIPKLCASCHSDVERMRPYNLPTDQYALYQTSQHGRRLATGDANVAVCTDCHGVHEIRPADDPNSSVFSRNIPATCGRCHGNDKLMQAYGHKDNAFADYKAGVHGKAFLDAGNSAAPECTRCHGTHGATPPGVGDIDKVCGQCHSRVRTYFLAGPHKAGMDAAGLPECVACHSNHRIEAAPVTLLDTVCQGCHAPGSEPVRVAGDFHNMYRQAAAELDSAETLVEQAAAVPLYVDDYKARLLDARSALMEALPAMHSLDVAQVEPHTRRARSIATEVSSEVHQKLAGRIWHYVGLGLFWFYLLLTAAIVVRARRRAAAERNP